MEVGLRPCRFGSRCLTDPFADEIKEFLGRNSVFHDLNSTYQYSRLINGCWSTVRQLTLLRASRLAEVERNECWWLIAEKAGLEFIS